MSQVAVTDIVLGTEGSNSGITVEMPFTTIARLEPGQSVIVPLKIYILHTSCEHLRVTVSFQYMCPRGSALKIISTAVDIINGGLEKACNALATMAETILSSLGSKPCVYKPQITGPDTLTESATNYFIAPLPSENKCPECTPLKCTDFVWTATGDAEIDGSHQGCGIMAKLKTNLANDGQGTLRAEYVDKPKQVNGCKVESFTVEANRPDYGNMTSSVGPALGFYAKPDAEHAECLMDITWTIDSGAGTLSSIGNSAIFTPNLKMENRVITAKDKRTNISESEVVSVVPLNLHIGVHTPSEDTVPNGKNSFISKDTIDAVAIIEPLAAFDMFKKNIQWEVQNAANYGRDSVKKTGYEVSFKPLPPLAPAPYGRGGEPLHYDLNAKLVVAGLTFTRTYPIEQDNLDILRQEYIDVGVEFPVPQREEFDQTTPPDEYPRLLDFDGGDIDNGHQWRIVKSLVENAKNLNKKYQALQSGNSEDKIKLEVTAGYRCPTGNGSIDIASKLSRHMKGKALDYDQGDAEENCRMWRASGDAGATERLLYYMAKNAAGETVDKSTKAPNCLPAWDEKTQYGHGHAGW